jgi:hypothetical protein
MLNSPDYALHGELNPAIFVIIRKTPTSLRQLHLIAEMFRAGVEEVHVQLLELHGRPGD